MSFIDVSLSSSSNLVGTRYVSFALVTVFKRSAEEFPMSRMVLEARAPSGT